MSDRTHNLIFYCLAALFGIILIYWIDNARDEAMRILLYPHAWITEVFYSISLVYIGGMGYTSADGLFAIGRQCMGSKFVMALFGMNACMFAGCFKGLKKAAWFITSLIGAVFLGILVSIIRIVVSVPLVAHPKFALYHASIGIFLYFLALIASYGFLKKIVRGDNYEENI